MDFHEYNGEPELTKLLVSFYDIDKFIELAKKVQGKDLFLLLNELSEIASESIENAGGHIIKFIGDSALIVFPETNANAGIRALITLKGQLESHLKKRGFANTISFSASFGNVAVGFMGKSPFRYLDIIGDAVQQAFYINGKPAKGLFSITEAVLYELDQETRTMFDTVKSPKIYVSKDQ
jgi:class 3 adenylate cyclase